MSANSVLAGPDPKPTGEALRQLALAAAALTPEPLPDLSHIPSFYNAPNLAWLGYLQADPRPIVPRQAHQVADINGLEAGPREYYGEEKVPRAVPQSNQDPRGTKRKRARDSPAIKPKLNFANPHLLAGKQMLVEAYLYDATLCNSASDIPWVDLGIASIDMTGIKRPVELVDRTITSLGVHKMIAVSTGKEGAKSYTKIGGNGLIWGTYDEPGRPTAERWHYCTPAIFQAFLAKWVVQETADDPGSLAVKVLMWRHKDARNACVARRKHVPMKAATVVHDT